MNKSSFTLNEVRTIGSGIYYYGNMIAFSFVLGFAGALSIAVYYWMKGAISTVDAVTLLFAIVLLSYVVVFYGALKLKQIAQKFSHKVHKFYYGALLYLIGGIIGVLLNAVLLGYVRFVNVEYALLTVTGQNPSGEITFNVLMALSSLLYGAGTVLLALDLMKIAEELSLAELSNWLFIMFLSGIFQLVYPFGLIYDISNLYAFSFSGIGGIGGVLAFYSLIVIGGRLKKLSSS